jgi:hypothetical protein
MRRCLLSALSIAITACAGTSTAPSTTTTRSTFVMTWNSPAFPATLLGTMPTTPLVVTLWNTGATAVPLGSIVDSNTGEFPWTTTCQVGGMLAANSNCSVTAQFKPAALGAQTATLTINANSTHEVISLTGTVMATPQLAITPPTGSTVTPFALSVTAATPGGQLTLQTIYTPAEGSPDMSFPPTTWTANASGQVTVNITSPNPGTYENWFIDVTSGLSTNHVAHTSVQ